MSVAAVEKVRRFNRTVTRRIGALDDEYLASGRPLGASRLLWEIGPDGAELRGLRARLGLDSGHLSRLLRRLEDERLVPIEPDPADGRVRLARVTAKGRRERGLLDRRSADPGHPALDPPRPRQREHPVEAR